jgi:hypothetical protein
MCVFLVEIFDGEFEGVGDAAFKLLEKVIFVFF